MKLLILPHQLFEINKIKNTLKQLNNITNISNDIKISDLHFILWEHPHYFTHYNFNKKKLVLHRATLKYYEAYLKNKKINQITYLDYKNKNKSFLSLLNKDESYLIFDPIDKIELPDKHIILESPNFLLTKEKYDQYKQKTDKYLFNNFYMWSKNELNILPNIKSQDKLNRQSLPKNINIPPLPSLSNNDTKCINNAIIYVEKHFPNNYGNTKNFHYPITHITAKRWLKNFIIKKFNNFGPYQDAIIKEESFLFHSILSSSINIGLLNPSDIIKEIMNYHKKNNIPLPSLEGYIRQLFWREYQRYCYIHYDFKNKNYFGNTKKLSNKWYTGTLGITPVDDCIKKGFNTAYLHHIERLMIVGNFMNLYGIHPMEGLKWFMEFSIDSYEWVMYQNVLDMVFFVSGGATMRKPYASSSNYILKMSNYKKDKWSIKWNEYYNKFIKKNKEKLWKYRYHFPTLTKIK